MKWTDNRSDDVEDRRGSGVTGIGIAGGGLGTIIIALVIFFLGGNPSSFLENVNQNESTNQQVEQRELSKEELNIRSFIQMLSEENNITWREIFEENGREYVDPKIVLFESTTQSGCGIAQSEMGPFYCPSDQKIYMDMSFFDELQKRYGAKVTEFTIAYVLAHEVGHHVQNLLGTLSRVDGAKVSSEYEKNKLSVATELQADFYAGVWARKTNDRTKILEPGDIESALEAAKAVGDDNIQIRSQGYVNQETFTHGSSQQRMHWFLKGYNTGDITEGNTFDEN